MENEAYNLRAVTNSAMHCVAPAAIRCVCHEKSVPGGRRDQNSYRRNRRLFGGRAGLERLVCLDGPGQYTEQFRVSADFLACDSWRRRALRRCVFSESERDSMARHNLCRVDLRGDYRRDCRPVLDLRRDVERVPREVAEWKSQDF